MKRNLLSTLCVTAILGASLYSNNASANFAGEAEESFEIAHSRTTSNNIPFYYTLDTALARGGHRGGTNNGGHVGMKKVSVVTESSSANINATSTGLAVDRNTNAPVDFGFVDTAGVSLFKRTDTCARDVEGEVTVKAGSRTFTAVDWDPSSTYFGVINGTNYSPSTGRGAGGTGGSSSTDILLSKKAACAAMLDVCGKTIGGVSRTATVNGVATAVDYCDESDTNGYYTVNDLNPSDTPCSGTGCVHHITCTMWCADTNKNKHCSAFPQGDCVTKCRLSDTNGCGQTDMTGDDNFNPCL